MVIPVEAVDKQLDICSSGQYKAFCIHNSEPRHLDRILMLSHLSNRTVQIYMVPQISPAFCTTLFPLQEEIIIINFEINPLKKY